MAFPDLTFRDQLPPDVRQELEQFVAILNGYLATEHDTEGAHTDINALSVTVDGPVVAEGDGTFGGDVTANVERDELGQHESALTNYLNASVEGATLRLGPEDSDNAFAIVADALTSRKRLAFVALGDNPGTRRYIAAIQQADTPVDGEYYLTHGPGSNSKLYVGAPTAALGVGFRVPGVYTDVADATVINASGTVTPAQITSDQNDYNPTGLSTASHLRLDVDAARNITGIVAQTHGRLLMVSNASGSFAITLKVASGSSSAGNQFAIANGADVVLRPNNGSVLLRYDSSIGSGFWFVIGA